MTYLLRTLALCLALAGLLVVAGCGGDTASKNDYVESINKAQTDFVSNVQKASTPPSTGGSPVDAAQGTFDNIDKAIDTVIKDLEAVEPPDEVKDLHADLISEMNDLQDEVTKAADSLDSKDPAKLAAAQQAFATNATKLQTRFTETITAINQKLQD